jgi:hypothetical protein
VVAVSFFLGEAGKGGGAVHRKLLDVAWTLYAAL